MAEEKKEAESKKILILKRSKQSLVGAEKFLSKRGWNIFSTDDLKVAVLKAMELKPDYIFIAFDHPNSKAANLPKVFKQVLMSTTIPYVETQSSFALHTMKKTDPKYFLTPPIIGPKIERILFKIDHDKEHENDPAQQKAKSQFQAQKTGGGDEMMIKIRGSNNQTIDSTSEAFKSLGLDGHEGSNHLQAGRIFNRATGSYQTEEEVNQFLTTEPIEKVQSLYAQEIPREEGESDEDFRKRVLEHLSHQTVRSERQAQEGSFFDEVYGRATEMSLDLNPDQEEPEVNMELLSQALKEMMMQAPESLLPKDLETPQSYERRMMNLFISHAKKNQLQVKDLSENFKMHFKSALEASTFKTLQDLQQTSQKQEVAHILSKTKKAQCFLIQGEGFKGYLVAASSSGDTLEKKVNYVKLIKGKLKEYLKETETEVDISESIQIQFQEVDFKSWSIEKADFIHKAVAEGEEVAMAYFSVDHPDLVTRESKNKDMLAVSLNEFMGEVPVEFDLFIHLPANDKFVHYTKEGFVLYSGQKERLDRRGVQEMHVQNTDLPDLKKYRVQNYFNNIIKDFKKSKGAA